MTIKHTPGPWRKEKQLIIHNCRDFKDPYCQVATVSNSYAESEANARLIAAAPEMLSSLMAMVICFERFEDTHTALVMDAARSAIAKATGQ